MNLLMNYCRVTKLKFPKATNIVGIASEAGFPPRRSEDFVYMDASRWSAEDEAEAKEIQNRFNLLQKVAPVAAREYEYPVDHKGRLRSVTPSRNSPCPCGSGKRYKRCHGEELLRKKRM
jgi:SEC-C motif